MKAMSVDDPPGDVAMLDETISGIRRLDSFLYTRTLPGWGALSGWAVVLDIEVKFNILDNRVNVGRKLLLKHTPLCV